MIGKYSALACSNTVYITSYYNGIAYYYVMIKSGNSITTNLLKESPTTEKNGVEVSIKNINYFSKFEQALKCVIFFPNIYVNGSKNAEDINTLKIKKFNNFAVSSEQVNSKILLGNVLYPLQEYHFNEDIRKIISNIKYTGIVIKFNIGELEITPNRENIIYNSNTIKLISDRILAAQSEMNKYIISKISKDYDNIIDYFNTIYWSKGFNFIDDTITGDFYLYYRIDIAKDYGKFVTFNGKDLSNSIKFISDLLHSTLPNFRGVMRDGKLYIKRLPWEIRNGYNYLADKILILNSEAKLTEIVRHYIRQNYNNYSIITDISEQKFIDSPVINQLCLHCKCNDTNNSLFIIKAVYKSLVAKAEKLDLSSNSNFISFKETCKNKKSNIKDFKEIILYRIGVNYYRDKYTFNSLFKAIEYIKGLKRGIILTEMDVDDKIFSTIATLKNMVFIKAKKDTVKSIKNIHLKCLVDTDWLLYKDPMLSIVKTIDKYFPSFIDRKATELCYYIRDDLKKEFNKLIDIDNKWHYTRIYTNIALRDNIKIDPYTEYLCLLLKKYLSKYIPVRDLVYCYNDTKAIISAILLKTKAFRINNDAYKEMKNNKVLNILCKK